MSCTHVNGWSSMTYEFKDGVVTLTMTREQYAQLLVIIGFAAGAVHRQENYRCFWNWIKFANELNRENPEYTPYEIAEQFR
jgi:hypothetical protein